MQDPKGKTVAEAFANVTESGRNEVVLRTDHSPTPLNHESQVLFEIFQQPQFFFKATKK